VAEDEHWQTNYFAASMTDPAVASQVAIVAAHNYDNTPPSGIPAALPRFDNPTAALWETEVSKLAGAGAFDGGMADALYWAGRLHLFMTVAEVNAWHYWWLISSNPDNEGLTDMNGIPAKRMYVLGQYSRFVRPGHYRIEAMNYNPYAVLITAYKDSLSGNFAIVVANTNSTPTNQSFYFTNFSAAAVTPWITSSNLSLAAQSAVAVSNSFFAYVIPAQSVVTFAGQARIDPPTIESINLDGSQVVLTVNGPAGWDYTLVASTNLTDWQTLFTSNAPAIPVTLVDTNANADPAQFYRVRLGL
jgi:glucuronoarabinoxylan endo-1,4-beta-xylanase